MKRREKFRKLKVPAEIEDRYLCGADTIPDITKKVYAMGNAIELQMGIAQTKQRDPPKKKPTNGQRCERNLKAEMKELIQKTAKASNEIHKRRQKRKATVKEKKLLKQLRTAMNGAEPTTSMIRMNKEIWIDTRKTTEDD